MCSCVCTHTLRGAHVQPSVQLQSECAVWSLRSGLYCQSTGEFPGEFRPMLHEMQISHQLKRYRFHQYLCNKGSVHWDEVNPIMGRYLHLLAVLHHPPTQDPPVGV